MPDTIRRTKKRGNGQGYTFKTNGGYVAVAQIYQPERLRKTRKFCTKKEAVEALPELRRELLGQAGRHKREPQTLALLYEGWRDSAGAKLSKSRQTAYQIAYGRLHHIKHTPIAELTIADLQCCIAGLTYYPARDVKSLLSHLYTRACAQQDTPSNLAQFIELPPLVETEAEAYTPEEVAAIWNAWQEGDQFAANPLIMIYTGMMPGELLACKKNMVDLKQQRITGAGKKTKVRRDNSIVFPDMLVPVIRRLMISHPYQSLTGMGRDAWYKAYHSMAERIGIRDLPPYSCRHTTGSRMAADETIAPSIITRTMRHSVAQTTERYKHIDEQLRLEALNKL